LELSCEDLSVGNIFGEVLSALRPLADKKTQALTSKTQIVDWPFMRTP